MIKVLSLYDSLFSESSMEMASSKAWKANQPACLQRTLHEKSQHQNPKCQARITQRRRGENSYFFGQVAGLGGRVDNLVVEDGEVERQAQADGMSGLHVAVADFQGRLVRIF